MLKIAWSEIFAHSLPDGHRFPMLKYELLPQQLIHEGTITKDNLFEPGLLNEEYILSTHCKTYWERLSSLKLTQSEIRKTGFPHSKELVHRESCIMSGTVMGAEYALIHGIAMNVAGGTHHAFTNRGEGFCLLNDIAIAANYLLNKKKLNKILVIDLDVHQGNGTAEIFKNNKQVFTFSMHGEKNFPLHKEKSDLDIALPDYTDDKFYLKILQETLAKLIEDVQPEFVFFLSGVDVLSTDRLGRLSLTREGCKERDKIVLNTCKINSIPVVVSMGGGYSEKINDIIEAHANTFRLAQYIYF
ncbi:MAG: histone deacetylase [Bacteroidetes bacterium]|nr:histone deacetylase [Bacteroidota bacterium]HET6243357.1 histone deacetylase [Bacteroidia bacterium]